MFRSLIAGVFFAPLIAAKVISDGWNDNIEWYSTKEALPLARQQKKPVKRILSTKFIAHTSITIWYHY